MLLVLAVVSSSLAQQSQEETGGRVDRRLALRRFRSRNRDRTEESQELKENRRQTPRKLANQQEIINRRKELLQRNNISRRKNFNRKPVVNQIEEEVATKRTVRIKSPSVEDVSPVEKSPAVEDDIPVEKISNSDRRIIEKVLKAEDEERDVPFSGQSEVRTVSSPGGFRSSNEQVQLASHICHLLCR